MSWLLILSLGLTTGVVSGLLGVGGGLLMVPIFTLLFKMEIHRAIGTSLAIIVPIALVGSFKHFLNGNVELKTLGFFVVAALVGSWLGATWADHVPIPILKRVFAVFLMGVAVYMFVKT